MRALDSVSGAVSNEAMVAINARCKLDRESEADFAAAFLGMQKEAEDDTRFDRIVATTFDHLTLVAISLGTAAARHFTRITGPI